MAKGKTVDFAPVETGDMSEIPPDAPAGGWQALCSVKKTTTQNGGFPMLILEWRLEEAFEDENKAAEGSRVSDFLTFFPANHTGTRMSRVRLKEMCANLKIDPPAVSRLSAWSDIQAFIDSLEGLRATVYTSVSVRKDNGEMRTNVHYTPPRGYEGAAPAPKQSEPAKVKKFKKKVAA